jgi:hypothetical protein
MSPPSLPVWMAVLGALEMASLCAGCIARRAGIPFVVAIAELGAMNVARAECGRPRLGPVEAWCQRCEAPRPVYRLCAESGVARA